MEIIFIAGRVLVGVLLMFSGLNHFMKLEMMTKYSASKGVPIPKIATILTGVMLILSGLSILAWEYVAIGLVIYGLFLIPVTLMMHAFWKAPKESKMSEMHYFMGNIMQLGFVLISLTFVV